jgi:integrase
MAKWPTGIDPHGNGIRIRLYAGGRLAFCETVAGDPYKASDLAAAVKRREELAARLALGLPLARGAASTAALFRDVAQDFLTAFDGAFSTADDYKNIINRHWLPAFGNWMVSDVDARHIKVELSKRKDLSAKTLKNIMAPLRGIFAYAMDAGLIKTNPAAAVKMKRPQKAHIDRFLPAERERILARLEGQPLLYFALLFGCGLRPGGEPLGLEWSDWDGEQLYVHQQIVRRQAKATTKTNMARKVYVPKWVRPLLKNAPTRFAGGPIFVNQRGTAFKDTDPFSYAWREALKAEGLEYRTPYTCRHTRAAELLSTGVDPGDAAAQLGHTTEMFFRVYSEWIEEFSGKKDLSRFEGLNRPETVQGNAKKNK